MGMGEHLPEFMTRSFRPAFIEPAEEKPAAPAPKPQAATPASRPASVMGKAQTAPSTASAMVAARDMRRC